jgi:predicted DNA-binding transcriptional regulator AlpA
MYALLDTAATAAMLGLAPETLRSYRNDRIGPPYVRVGPRAIRYDRAAVLAWLTVQNTDTASAPRNAAEAAQAG